MIYEKAFAKINLFLDIESKRQDGYHNIVSVMQTVDWFDEIFIDKSVSGDIEILMDSENISCGKDNTAYIAAKKYLSYISDETGLKIEIHKHIPIAAGMAGGSADAAAVLRGLNRFFHDRLSQQELLKLGENIGADVPFCLVGGTKLIKGIGQEIFPCDNNFPKCPILCAKLGEGVSTPQAYKLLDEIYDDFDGRNIEGEKLKCLFDEMARGSAQNASKGFFNIFESAVCKIRPHVTKIKNTMLEHGAFVSMMSGSGPSVFGLFQNERDAQTALEQLKKQGAEAKVCYPVEI